MKPSSIINLDLGRDETSESKRIITRIDQQFLVRGLVAAILIGLYFVSYTQKWNATHPVGGLALIAVGLLVERGVYYVVRLGTKAKLRRLMHFTMKTGNRAVVNKQVAEVFWGNCPFGNWKRNYSNWRTKGIPVRPIRSPDF